MIVSQQFPSQVLLRRDQLAMRQNEDQGGKKKKGKGKGRGKGKRNKGKGKGADQPAASSAAKSKAEKKPARAAKAKSEAKPKAEPKAKSDAKARKPRVAKPDKSEGRGKGAEPKAEPAPKRGRTAKGKKNYKDIPEPGAEVEPKIPATFARRRRPQTKPLKWDSLRKVFTEEIRPSLIEAGKGTSFHEDCSFQNTFYLKHLPT